MATKEQINLFLSDPDYAKLLEMEREQRLLFITDLSETRVSAFLGWLFRPFEGHGLGDRPVRELLLAVWRKVNTDEMEIDSPPPTPKEIFDWSYRDLLVETEYQIENLEGRRGRGRAIDIVVISRRNKLVIVIENKFGSKVHSDQLRDYRKGIIKRFPDYRHVFVYLDSNEENRPDDAEWISVDYRWMVSMIESQQESGLASDRALDALGQFRDYLDRETASLGELEVKRDGLIESVASRHSQVLGVIRELNGIAWHKGLDMPTGGIHEPLLISYRQHRNLWRNVLSQSHHAPLIAAARERFGEQLDVVSGPSEVFFRLKKWQRFEKAPESSWGPRVSAWSGRGGNGLYDVWAAVAFGAVRSERESDVRKAAIRLRDPLLKAAPKAAEWVRISRQNEMPIGKASSRIVSELSRLDLEFSELN